MLPRHPRAAPGRHRHRRVRRHRCAGQLCGQQSAVHGVIAACSRPPCPARRAGRSRRAGRGRSRRSCCLGGGRRTRS